MIRIVLLFFILQFVTCNATNVDKKIKNTTKVLHSYSKSYKELNRKLAKTADAILHLKRKIADQKRMIAELEKEGCLKKEDLYIDVSDEHI